MSEWIETDPFIRIEFRSMKHAITKAISKELLGMDKIFTKAVEDACSPENVRLVLHNAIQQCLVEEVNGACKKFFERGKGHTEIIRAVTETLTARFEDQQRWEAKNG